MATRAPIGTQRRWSILQRDAFTCQFCGARPGNDRLHVDHIVPWSLDGSDHDNNLVAACDRCNLGKGARIAAPPSMMDGFRGRDGWFTWKRWGEWHLMIDDDGEVAVLTFQPDGLDYWIPLPRVHEDDWHDHLEWKPWMRDDDEIARIDAFYDARAAAREKAGLPISMSLPEFLSADDAPMERSPARGERWANFCDAIAFARTLIRKKQG